MGKTVVIGCKLPNGLHLRVGQKTAVLKGSNSSVVHGGYGLTSIDEEFFNAWKAEHREYEPLKRGLIFVSQSAAAAASEGNEKAEVKNGFEPVDPNAPGLKVEPVPEESED